MSERGSFRSSTNRIEFAFTSRSDGDFSLRVEPPDFLEVRSGVVAHEWCWLEQVHGAEVVVVEFAGQHRGTPADALVTNVVGAVLAVQTADCAPVLFAWPGNDRLGPIVGAAHGGWRGLYEGVIEATVDEMVRLGAVAREIEWRLGPCISPEAYEFSAADLTTLALRFGPEVVAATSQDGPAFDLRAAVRSCIARSGLDPHGSSEPACTALATESSGEPRFHSWRRRSDVGRQTSAIWIEP